MSYDVYIKIDTGGEHPGCVEDVGNYTYNCSGMLVEACGKTLSAFDKKLCSDVWPEIEKAIHAIRMEPTKYKAMNPSNGWGDCDSWLEYLTKISDACKRHPKAFLAVT